MEFIIPTVQFFIIPALHIWLLPCWHVHFISVRLHSPINIIRPCNHLVVERGDELCTHFKHFNAKVSTFYLSTMSSLHIRGEVCAFWFFAVLIPDTPTRKGWGWVGALGVSKIEWMRPNPTPNKSFAPFWQMGNNPLPNARPLLQNHKHPQETRWAGAVYVIV